MRRKHQNSTYKTRTYLQKRTSQYRQTEKLSWEMSAVTPWNWLSKWNHRRPARSVSVCCVRRRPRSIPPSNSTDVVCCRKTEKDSILAGCAGDRYLPLFPATDVTRTAARGGAVGTARWRTSETAHVDRSAVEVLANDRQCAALRVYPSRDDSLGVSVRSYGSDATLRSLDAWQIGYK